MRTNKSSIGKLKRRRMRLAVRNGAPIECAQAFAAAGITEPTLIEFVEFLKVYLTR